MDLRKNIIRLSHHRYLIIPEAGDRVVDVREKSVEGVSVVTDASLVPIQAFKPFWQMQIFKHRHLKSFGNKLKKGMRNGN